MNDKLVYLIGGGLLWLWYKNEQAKQQMAIAAAMGASVSELPSASGTGGSVARVSFSAGPTQTYAPDANLTVATTYL